MRKSPRTWHRFFKVWNKYRDRMAAKKAQKRRHTRTMERRRTRPSKGQARYRYQCKAMAFNMSTRAGAVAGLQWVALRDTVAAQKGFTTKALQGLRRSWVAMERDPERLTWVEFLKANRA